MLMRTKQQIIKVTHKTFSMLRLSPNVSITYKAVKKGQFAITLSHSKWHLLTITLSVEVAKKLQEVLRHGIFLVGDE